MALVEIPDGIVIQGYMENPGSILDLLDERNKLNEKVYILKGENELLLHKVSDLEFRLSAMVEKLANEKLIQSGVIPGVHDEQV